MSELKTNLLDDLRDLLTSGQSKNQEVICNTLMTKGHDVNQSKVSRMLRKIGAIKTKNEMGQIVYALPWEPAPPTPDSLLGSLLIDISANECHVLITTSPGAAQLLARMLDFHKEKINILGTIAGDDTILVIPSSITQTQSCLKKIKSLLLSR